MRKERAGQYHIRRVGRLLYEIEGEPKGVRKLWQNQAFFITAAGQSMNESQISKRIVVLGKRLNPEMSGNLRGSRIRKGIITLQRAEVYHGDRRQSGKTDEPLGFNSPEVLQHSGAGRFRHTGGIISQVTYISRGTQRKATRKKDEDESLLFDPEDVKIRFVPDPVADDQQQERPHHIEIRFVPDTGVTTNLGAREANPTDGREKDHVDLNQEEKRKLLKLFQDLLNVGRVPPKQIFNQRKIGNNTLRTVRYEKVVGYMQHKSQINLTSADKCK